MKIIVRKFGCFKNFLLYLETLLHITRLVFVIRKKLMSESSQNSTQILLDGKNGSPNSKQHRLLYILFIQSLFVLGFFALYIIYFSLCLAFFLLHSPFTFVLHGFLLTPVGGTASSPLTPLSSVRTLISPLFNFRCYSL